MSLKGTCSAGSIKINGRKCADTSRAWVSGPMKGTRWGSPVALPKLSAWWLPALCSVALYLECHFYLRVTLTSPKAVRDKHGGVAVQPGLT